MTEDIKSYFTLSDGNKKLINQFKEQRAKELQVEGNAPAQQADDTPKPVNFKLQYNKKDGKVKNSKFNYQAILTYDPNLKGLLRYNVDTQEMEITEDRDLPQPAPLNPIHLKKGFIDDTAIQNINSYIATNESYQLDIPMASFMQALVNVTDSQQWDPLRDWIETLKWDGTDRLGTVLQTFLGADDTEANRFGFKLWMMGAVGKIYDKECKFDYVLDLVGGQGVGKSTFLKMIAPLDMYTDQFNSFTNKDDLAIMRKNLIVNDDEMAASDRSSFEEIKRFVTETQFQFRKAYARADTQFHKSFVFARTSNHIEHLADKTGDRRFIPIECSKDNAKKSIFTDLDKDYINQMWAEAKELFESQKDPFMLTKEKEQLLEDSRQKFIKNNPTEKITLDLLSNEFSNTNFVFNSQLRMLLQDQLGKSNISKNEYNSATGILLNNGWESGRKKNSIGKTERGYKRKNPIHIDPTVYTVEDWIDSEINHRIVNDRHMPYDKNDDLYHQPIASSDADWNYGFDYKKNPKDGINDNDEEKKD